MKHSLRQKRNNCYRDVFNRTMYTQRKYRNKTIFCVSGKNTLVNFGSILINNLFLLGIFLILILNKYGPDRLFNT